MHIFFGLIQQSLTALFAVVILVVGIVLFIPWVLYTSIVTIPTENAHFAANKFKDQVQYSQVLETRALFDIFEFSGCTYAIVSLPDTASTTPPSTFLRDAKWSTTPLNDLEPRFSNSIVPHIVDYCAEKWSPETAAKLTAAIKEPGSYYFSFSNDSIYIYSAPQKIAAYLRDGD